LQGKHVQPVHQSGERCGLPVRLHLDESRPDNLVDKPFAVFGRDRGKVAPDLAIAVAPVIIAHAQEDGWPVAHRSKRGPDRNGDRRAQDHGLNGCDPKVGNGSVHGSSVMAGAVQVGARRENNQTNHKFSRCGTRYRMLKIYLRSPGGCCRVGQEVGAAVAPGFGAKPALRATMTRRRRSINAASRVGLSFCQPFGGWKKT
jgi:hypothetical protein